MGVQSYNELEVWQLGMDLAVECYRLTKQFPREELFGLVSQIRRAAGSIPANIAEGQARFSGNEFYFFLGRARGSLVEVETQLMIAQNLAYFTPEQGRHLLDKAAEVGKILNGLIGAIRPAA